MSTTQQLIDYYANLLIKQYLGKPRAFATIQTVVTPFLMPQGHNILLDNEGNWIVDNEGNPVFDSDFTEPILPIAVSLAFDMADASGVQLDAIAKYIGVSRFGFDFSGAVTLDDDQFRLLIRIKSDLNILKADTASIQAFVHKWFDGIIQVFDNLYMHMSYFYLAEVGTEIVAEFFVKLGLLPRPLGVGSSLTIRAFPANDFFGFRTVDIPAPVTVTGFNSVADPQIGTFLTTAYGIPA